MANSEGFVIPAVIFSLILMSTLAVAAILTAQDEMRSSRAVRESVTAMYAAEAGLNQVWATWDDSLVDNLNPGDSVDLGWSTLPNGSSYRAVVYRFDNGGQQVFGLVTEGRGRGALGGQRMVSLSLSKTAPKPICCTSAGMGGGDALEVEGSVSGLDMIPAGWGGACSNTLEDKPGAEWHDAGLVTGPGSILGTPPIAEDTTLNTTNVFDWGDLNFDTLVARADHTLPNEINGGIGPSTSGGSCDEADWQNWGAPTDSTHVCFDYFPILYRNGELRIRDFTGASGQGILLVDGNLRIEDGFDFYGLVMVRGGEFRDEDNVNIIGGVITNGRTRIRNASTIQYSQCAANRAILSQTFLSMTDLLSTRSWGEVMR